MIKSKVYFTEEISGVSMIKIYDALGKTLSGKTCVKLSTGESGGHNYLNPTLIKPLVDKLSGTVVECCTAYAGKRIDPKEHWQVIKEHGFFDIAPCEIMDEYGDFSIPVNNGLHLKVNYIGKGFKKYDSMLILSHFKGHAMGGFGGALKNMSIGIASTKGKTHIHTAGVYTFDADGKYVIKNGIVNGTYYENDKPVEAGLIKIGDALYYVKAGGWVVTNGSRYVPDTAISDEVRELGFTAGVYAFDVDGKYVIKNGIVNGTYYENDKPVEAGLIKIGDALYYVKAGGWVVTNGSRYVPDTAISDEVRELGFTAGVYAFDADGKYVLKNGIIDGYYFENGKTVEAGLVRVDGKIYYVKAGGWVVTNGSRYVPDTAISAELKREGFVGGVYSFDSTGALIE